MKITFSRFFKFLFIWSLLSSVAVSAQSVKSSESSDPPVYIAFHWHMHQPIYWPYESVVETEARGAYSFSLQEVHTSRTGPYTSWPANAVQAGIDAGLPNFGAQVSFSGSLIENLEAANKAGWGFNNWTTPWNEVITQTTAEGNARLEMTGFGYHHPLMPLIGPESIQRQVQWHKEILSKYFEGEYSKGIFPPETAFSPRIIPPLVEEGFEWILVDNLHFERAAAGAPLGDQTGVKRPNRADVRNPNPGDWNQLNGLWAPTAVSMQWAHQPHYVSYTDPETGEISKMIAVPASRYLGEEDGRGGFGALQYETVMSQFEEYNTDPDHPILLVLHHDGDNHGGGSETYYNHNFDNMINWLESQPDRFQVTTIQDYLDRFPPNPDDIIHVQDGSWLGADGGDPEFKKWLGDPGAYEGSEETYSPDRNSWGVITAAQNIVKTAEQVDSGHPDTERAWEFLMNGQASDYWYWDGTEIWDSNPTRAANQAIQQAIGVAESGTDQTGPALFLPQRTPYNPGGIEWDAQGVMPSDFDIWTYAYDFSGLEYVKLYYRVSSSDVITEQNKLYAGGNWEAVEMQSRFIESITEPKPTYKAKEFRTTLEGLENVMIDYYVEAVDTESNISRSIIQHVWVGDAAENGTSPEGPISWTPEAPTIDDVITITVADTPDNGRLHWGVNDWMQPIEAYWPEGTVLFKGEGPAVQTPFKELENGDLEIEIGPFNNENQSVDQLSFVINYEDGSWDNNTGNDYIINLNISTSDEGEQQPREFMLMQNYPNPFNPTTVIPFQLEETGAVRLLVYDMLGREVAMLVDERLSAGSYQVPFDASGLAGGAYIYRIESNSQSLSRMMMLVK